MSEAAATALTSVLLILVVVDIVGNSLVCAILKRNRDMRIPINYLLLNLAAADILYAMFIAPNVFFKLTFNHPEGMTGTVLCKLLTGGNVAFVGSTSSFVTLAAVAIERYYAVMYPLGDKGKLTKRKLKVVIPGSWIFSLLLNIPLFLVYEFDKENKSCMDIWPEMWMSQAFTLTWEIVAVLNMALMVVLYTRVVYTLWFKSNVNNQLTQQQMGVMKVRKRVTLMVLTISVIFGICWGTDVAIYVIKYIASYNIGPVPVTIANTMVLFNSAVNPFVYALLNKQFREKMKRMICCTSCCTVRVHPFWETQAMELAVNTTYQTHKAETSSQGCRDYSLQSDSSH